MTTLVATPAAAIIAGLITSVHCAGMCGPLACSLCTLNKSESSRLIGALSYHFGRLISYTTIGALCGALGQQPLKWFFNSPALILPWLLFLLFVGIAFNLHKKLPTPLFIQKLTQKLSKIPRRLTAKQSGLALGLATPLLPCGPLYLLFAACLTAGSALRGAEFALAFGIGTIPLLWIAQHSFHKLRHHLPKNALPILQRGLALVAAIMLFIRLQGTLPTSADDIPQNENFTDLPSCCH